MNPYHYIFPVPIKVTVNKDLVPPPCPNLNIVSDPTTISNLIKHLTLATNTVHEQDLITAYQHRRHLATTKKDASTPVQPTTTTINYSDFESPSAPHVSSNPTQTDWDALHNVIMMPNPLVSRHPSKLLPPPPPQATDPTSHPNHKALLDMGFLPEAISIALDAFGDNLKTATDFCLLYPSLPKPIPPHAVLVKALKSIYAHLSTKGVDHGLMQVYLPPFISLNDMGFDPETIVRVLVSVQGDWQLALDLLMESN